MTSVLSSNKALLTRIDLAVRTYDIDFNNHVSNIVYIRWLEDMRNILFGKIMSLQECVERGYMPVLISTNINYKQAINLFDQPHGLIWVSSYGRTSFTLEEEILVGDKLCASAKQGLVFLDRANAKPLRLPQIIQDKFSSLGVKREY